MTEALCYLEIEMENTSLIDLLPSLEIVAKLNGLRLNRTKDFRLAKRLLIMNIYLNVRFTPLRQCGLDSTDFNLKNETYDKEKSIRRSTEPRIA